jgi:hypothetical protein
LQFDIDGTVSAFLHMHWPHDCGYHNTTYHDVLSFADECLSELWQARPWKHLILAGDLNVQVPSAPPFGPAVSGRAWCQRSELLVCFLEKWSLTPVSTFCDEVSYTHIADDNISTSVLDYIYLGAENIEILHFPVNPGNKLRAAQFRFRRSEKNPSQVKPVPNFKIPEGF